MKRILLQRVVAVGVPIYKCDVCGVEAEGAAATLEVRARVTPQSDYLREALEREAQAISNQHMPIGWASYGPKVHKCPKCQT